MVKRDRANEQEMILTELDGAYQRLEAMGISMDDGYPQYVMAIALGSFIHALVDEAVFESMIDNMVINSVKITSEIKRREKEEEGNKS
jgi:hypothetical protein